MSYLALYRKWRPMTFGEVVGQPHIVTTLRNALAGGRTSHAYLFCGSRGTGKTSMAKILAKALNCQDMVNGEPCNQCSSCLKINQGNFMDILEIDAASNRGIDEMRELREKIGLAPAEGLYKVYIIDEVHMLTTEAFNALLKTLEEPPAHVVFILATTEPHKIPLTIVSRCQRFEFHRIGVPEITGRLREITEESAVVARPEALTLIAKLAQGGLRDALSLLDQCLSSLEGELTSAAVAEIAGVAGEDFVRDWVQDIIGGNAAGALHRLQQAVSAGKQPGQLLNELIYYFRNMLVLELGPEARELVPVPEDILRDMERQAAETGRERILTVVETLSRLGSEMRFAAGEQIVLEAALVRLSRMFTPDSLRRKPEPEGMQKQAAVLPVAVEPATVPEPDTETGPADGTQEEPQTGPSGEPEAAAPEVPVQEAWEHVLEQLKADRKLAVLAFVVEGKPRRSGQTFYLEFPEKYSFHKTRAEKPEVRQEIEQYLCRTCGQEMTLACVFQEEETAPEPVKAAGDLLSTVESVFGKDKVIVVEEEK